MVHALLLTVAVAAVSDGSVGQTSVFPPQDAVPFKAELSPRGPGSRSEPEPVYSEEAADYAEASGHQGLAYAPEAVYESAEDPGHYQAGTGEG